MPSVAARCNNPLNIRPGAPYEGMVGQSMGFCVFKSAPWGFRAAFRNYITKSDRGINTVAKLIGEWAPPGDNNDTAAYIKSVCQKTGFGPDEILSLKLWNVASAVCYAQAEVESGEPFETNWTLAQMAEGAFRAGIVDAPKPLVSKLGSTAASVGSAAAGAAAAIQPTVEAASNAQHSPNVRAFLVVLCIVLSVVAAIVRPKVKTEG
jgi:hypothetical protein